MVHSVATIALAAGMLLACKKAPALPDAPTAEIAAPSSPAAAPAGNASDFNLDVAASKVGFAGVNPLGIQEGKFTTFTGTMKVEGGDVSKLQSSVSVDTKSLQTAIEALTNDLKSPNFLDVEKFPRATFEVVKVSAGGTGGSHTVEGNLELHGQKKLLRFPANISITDQKATLKAKFVIDRHAFGVSYKGAPDLVVADGVVIELDLVGTRK
jgi:polyisoprenoid-binding protein YceI